VRTDEPLYSSNSLESSSISVYATLMCETGRSREERAVIEGAKKGSLDLPLPNMCMLGSRGVMGDMACWGRIRTSGSKWVCQLAAHHGKSCGAVGNGPALWAQQMDGGLTTEACRRGEHDTGAGRGRGVGKRKRALRAEGACESFCRK
jgi:hypothetical protein